MTAKKTASRKPAKKTAAKTSARDDTALHAAIRAAEGAAQRSVCNVPAGDPPEDLVEALELRVKANLAATGGKPLTACGGSKSEVARLEAPYRKPRAAVVDPEPDAATADVDPANDKE